MAALGNWALWLMRGLSAISVALILADLILGYRIVLPGSEMLIRPALFVCLVVLLHGLWQNIGTRGAGADEPG